MGYAARSVSGFLAALAAVLLPFNRIPAGGMTFLLVQITSVRSSHSSDRYICQIKGFRGCSPGIFASVNLASCGSIEITITVGRYLDFISVRKQHGYRPVGERSVHIIDKLPANGPAACRHRLIGNGDRKNGGRRAA